ncbi:sensor histidine kinase [Riemerella columbipharyngis]|uniref:histidine kinase n=1 Tax=Riemerella columbipharyngis TaxID=1071918 RepID=A0A1G7AU67_9FLAO|nr:ATP-binding protein [Riemerella columbipharyngis]SDE18343.1 two-component system, OmpR family, phosphate regulon sensor histidine kinase PhoR [Riemerella columbipharyngis]
MKMSKLTAIAAFLLTISMGGIVLSFNYLADVYLVENDFFYVFTVASLLIAFGINYIVIERLFSYYGKRKIRQISDKLSNEIVSDNEEINFRQLGERIQKTTSEIDMMKEMETYRKEYIGNISHELKTPLFTIQGYVETLQDGGVEDLSIRDKYLERISKSLDRLLNIVKDLDMINRFESGEITLAYSRFDINALIKEIFDFMDLEVQKKGAKLLFKGTGALYVLADKQKISQVLINLISNSIHYSNRTEATITVTTKDLENRISVEVQDNGMGIKPEILPRIFERFYRVESSRSRREGGSGLGLAIVKHIMEAHYQSVEVYSEYLEGACFTFYLDKG